ncbi:MAG: choice-of-anchor J domain-containing protein [[Clostridium] fimetarium]|nr:choice-of-anchor J domain-containing protein [Alistipes timonensis]MCM1405774.1 choice-of-anchor J domain-containing protein [[Clostridium] fimetarium]
MNNYTRFLALATAALIGGSMLANESPRMTMSGGLSFEMAPTKGADASRAALKMAGTTPARFLSAPAKPSSRRAAAKAVANPTGVRYVDEGNKVTINWSAVEGASEYKVYEAGATTADIKSIGTTSETTFTIDRQTDAGEGGYTVFGVSAVVNGEESQIAATPVLTTGAIAPLPWKESFRNGQTDKFFWTECTSINQWGLLTDASGLPSMDNDNGVLAFLAYKQGDYLKVHTEKISLAGNPYLVFTRYYVPTQNVGLSIIAYFPDGTSRPVFSSTNSGTAAAYWKTEVVDLTAYKKYRYCTLSFNFTSNANFSDGGALVALDALQVIDNKMVDVSATLDLPSKVMKGQTITGDLVISNNSLFATPALDVYVEVNGKAIIDGTLQGTLSALGTGLLGIEIPTSSLTEGDKLNVTARMTVAGDEVPENDTDAVEVAMEQTWRKPVSDLRLFRTPENGISAEWNVPGPNSKPVEDGFEDYAPWATEFGEWTTVDTDLAFHGGVYPVSDYPGQMEQFAFKVMTPEEIGEANDAKSGRSYLGAPFGVLDDPDQGATYAASDAWLISPELSGEGHTGSFHAASTKAYNALWELYEQTEETFYIMYSTTGNSVADFKDYCYAGSISNKKYVDDANYVKVEFVIPEGARYFAIHHTTPAGDGCMFRLDDFSYIAGGTPESYNLYADGKLVGNVKELKALDTDGKAAKYAVTAVYRDGSESLPAEMGADQASVSLIGADGEAAPFDIYNLQGVVVRRAATSVADASLAPGVYIANGRKFIIK